MFLRNSRLILANEFRVLKCTSINLSSLRYLHNSSIRLENRKYDKEINSLANDIASIDKSHIILKDSETESNDSFRTNDLKQKIKHSTDKHLHQTHTHEDSALHSLNPLAHTHTHTGDISQENFYKDLLSAKSLKGNPAVKITVIGLLSNVGLAVLKFTGGFMYHSYALIADAMHTLTDLFSDFLTLFSCKLTMKNSNKNGLTSQLFMGPGKIDTLSSLAVYSINLIAGLSIGLDALMMVTSPILPVALKEILHIHSHLGVVGIEAGVIALFSIFLKEWLYWKTTKVATEVKSNVLLANAYHHRVDSLSAMVAMVSISSSFFFNFAYLDAIGGLIISGILIRSGFSGVWNACGELLDKKVLETSDKYKNVKMEVDALLDNLVSNNNSDIPYKLKQLTVLPCGAHLNCFIELTVPDEQKWGNILDINEFESVREHLAYNLREKYPEINKVFIEFKKAAAKSDTQLDVTESQEKKQFEINKSMSHVEGAHICSDDLSSGHTHTHSHNSGDTNSHNHTHKH
ncbi:cation efflux protein [Hanseniaspora valbyensis NRRL Y-1626]|uniref:Cation efflux protein n=1 Tax=Hanseniaspora valbyensis NRRL Y-1626 TaxID=766949 RepID=A0A1B7TC11_9ASCO|nr:cation efflux protein [Hanseniaspora valbyensis NRRL Y-1626]